MDGFSVLIHQLAGNDETVAAVQGAIGKTIKSLVLDDDDHIVVRFTDGTGIELFDDGQSCCESRYVTTDDDLAVAAGTKLVGAEMKYGANTSDEDNYSEHEQAFLELVTDVSRFTFVTHVEHNGYYGGFAVVARELPLEGA